MKLSFVYIINCSDSPYYTGITSGLEKRIFEHNNGKHQDNYTFKRRPLSLVFFCATKFGKKEISITCSCYIPNLVRNTRAGVIIKTFT